jgi:hypothetical protein
MFTVITVLAVLAVLLVLVLGVVRLMTRRSSDRAVEPAHQGVVRPSTAAMPAPGEPAPRRPDGSPVPGSRDDRHRHGMT